MSEAETPPQRPPVQVIQVVPQDVWSQALRWVFGQEVSTVILMLILAGGGYMTYWHLTVGVPASESRRHAFFDDIRKQNNDGHRENAKAFIESNEKNTRVFSESLEKVQATFEKEIDRVERRSSARLNQ